MRRERGEEGRQEKKGRGEIRRGKEMEEREEIKRKGRGEEGGREGMRRGRERGGEGREEKKG